MAAHEKRRQRIRRIAQRTKLYLGLVLLLLTALALLLAFRVGERFWPAWMSTYRTLLIGLDLLGLVTTLLLSPLIIEANSNPRPLSGPGHDPRQGWG